MTKNLPKKPTKRERYEREHVKKVCPHCHKEFYQDSYEALSKFILKDPRKDFCPKCIEKGA